MARRRPTFASQLQSARLANVYLDENLYSRLRSLVREYLEIICDATLFDLFIEQQVSGSPGLKAAWGVPGRSFTLRNGKESTGLCAFCFEQGKPLWVVATDGGVLPRPTELQDLWSECERLPAYLDTAEGFSSKTLIAIPVRIDGLVRGVVNVESRERLEPTTAAKHELQLLADEVHQVYRWQLENGARRGSLDRQIEKLRVGLREVTRLSLFGKPKIFFASSSKADPEVVGEIRGVLDGLADVLEPVFWEEIHSSGHIDQQIYRQIEECAFGICYLSEPTGSSKPPYFRDNPNVLFEAGLLQAQAFEAVAAHRNWIPVREPESPEIPFDFSSQRILTVPRLQDGDFNGPGFRGQLRKRLESLTKHAWNR